MSIENPSDFPLDGSEVGADLWPLLNRLEAAIVSNYANASRAPEIADGGLWSKEETNGTHTLNIYSFGRNVPLLRTTTAGAATSQWFYTKQEVDNLIEEVAGQIGDVAGVPIGGIILWSGATTAVPSGWRLCDGGGGTPNLRDRFVVGAGGGYAVGANGGRDAITETPRHTHTFSDTTSAAGGHNHGGVTAAAGSHTHSARVRYGTIGNGINIDGVEGQFSAADNESQNTTTYPIPAAGNHNHGIPATGDHTHSVSGTTGATGSTSVDIRPKYYALAYIMRIS